MRMLTLALAVSLCMLLANGCASLKVVDDLNGQRLSPEGETMAHVYGDTYGLYLLYYIPLFTGRTDRPGSTALFAHTVKVENVVDMVTAKSKELGGTRVDDLQTFTYSKTIFPIILWSRRVEASGNIVR